MQQIITAKLKLLTTPEQGQLLRQTQDEQDEWQQLRAGWDGADIRPLTAARYCDDLLDLVHETGNHGLDFIMEYVLGYSEGLLCGRVIPLGKRKRHSA